MCAEENMENQTNQVDPHKVCCRIVDVYESIQRAFIDYSQGEDNTLEGLANKIQDYLSIVPAFVVEDSKA